MKTLSCLVFCLVAVFICRASFCQEATPKRTQASAAYESVTDILYREDEGLTDYMKQRCRLDVYYPTGIKDFPTVVWFHGGGLKSGKRSIPDELKEQGGIEKRKCWDGTKRTLIFGE